MSYQLRIEQTKILIVLWYHKITDIHAKGLVNILENKDLFFSTNPSDITFLRDRKNCEFLKIRCKFNQLKVPKKKIESLIYFMEQLKFRTIPTNVRQKTYLLNKANHPTELTQESFANTTSYTNLITNFRNEQIASGLGRLGDSRKKTLCKNAKAEIANRNLSKQTLKKLRKVNTEGNRSSESELKRIKNLKNHIRGITKVCNKLQKNKTNTSLGNYQLSEIAQRLTINNLSFADIEEKKIEKQRSFLKQFQHLKRKNSNMISTPVQGQEKAIAQCLVHIFRHIDKLYAILQEMEFLGYFKKNNKSIINFCTTNKVWLSQIFLHESKNHKDAFSIKSQWLVVPSAEQAKLKLSNYLAKAGKVDFHIINNDIEDLLDYVEHSLGQKRLNEISKLGDYIQSRIKEHQFQDLGGENIQILRIAKSKHHQSNLSKQLSQFEETYGSMNMVTKVSRRRFEDLCRTYDKLQGLL